MSKTSQAKREDITYLFSKYLNKVNKKVTLFIILFYLTKTISKVEEKSEMGRYSSIYRGNIVCNSCEILRAHRINVLGLSFIDYLEENILTYVPTY